jgi:hypothetical protein
LVVKPEGKRTPERPRHRWKGNIKWFLKMGWIYLGCDRDKWGVLVECGNECWQGIF